MTDRRPNVWWSTNIHHLCPPTAEASMMSMADLAASEHLRYQQSYWWIQVMTLVTNRVFSRIPIIELDDGKIGWWENLQETPIFDGKNHVDFPLNQSIEPKIVGLGNCLVKSKVHQKNISAIARWHATAQGNNEYCIGVHSLPPFGT